MKIRFYLYNDEQLTVANGAEITELEAFDDLTASALVEINGELDDITIKRGDEILRPIRVIDKGDHVIVNMWSISLV